MSEGIVEIRDYTIEEKWFAKYKEWANEFAAPWLKNNLDVIDFWMDSGIPSEVTGSSPQVSPNGLHVTESSGLYVRGTSSLYLPPGQSLQEDTPRCTAYLPGAHEAQVLSK